MISCDYNVVRFAKEILAMDRELELLRAQVIELEQYREKYTQLLDSSIDHNKNMMGNILDIALMPGVMEAISQHNTD